MIRSHDLVCHTACLEAKLRPPSGCVCPDCEASLEGLAIPLTEEGAETNTACDNCGRPLGGAAVCPVCGLPLFDFQAQVKGRLRSSVDYVYRDESCYLLHDFCAKVDKAKIFLEEESWDSLNTTTPWRHLAAVLHDLAVSVKLSADDYWVIRSRVGQERLRVAAWVITLVALACVGILVRTALRR